MPTREQFSQEIEDTLKANGVDAEGAQALGQILEQFNANLADLDDELAAVARRLLWLSTVSWTNQRPAKEFRLVIDTMLTECEAVLAVIRARWEKQRAESPTDPQGL